MGDFVMRVPKGFLRRKFTAPQLPNPYVPEEKVTSSIMDEASWRVCLINAAAGYGKTALMAQWFHEFARRDGCFPLWMTLDERDSSLSRIVQGVSCMLAAVDDRFFELAKEPASEDEADLALIDIVNLADEVCDSSACYVVFFDGYGHADSRAFDKALLFLNRFCSDNFRFVVSGSYFSPKVDDLLLDSSVIELRTRDLAFDEDRLRRLAYALMPDLTEGEFADLCETSGMWPASFVFSSLARKRRGSASYHKTMEGYHRRFFSKEVMDDIDAPTYEFLVETAFLEWLAPDLCDCVTGGSNSRGILELLESRNLFIHFDEALGAYVHQPTFRRFLLDKTLSLRAGYTGKLAQRAAAWFESRGMRDEYAKYAAASCDVHYVKGSIQSSTGMTPRPGYSSFMDYLLSQPAQRFEKDPYLAWVAVWTFISIGLPDEARYWLSVVRVLEGESGDGLAYDYADAICLALEGDSRKSLSVIRRVLDEGGADLPRAFQCLLIHMEGENCERLGSPREGRDLYLKALALAERADGAFYKLFDMYCLAHQHVGMGELDDAVAMACRALDSCEDGSTMFGELHAIIAFVDIERGNLDEAARHLAIAEKCVSGNANMDMYIDIMATKARYEIARRNQIEAYEILSEVAALIAGKKVPRNFDMEAYAILTRLAIDLGEHVMVRQCERALDGFVGNADFLRSAPCMMAKAHVLWIRGDREGAFEMLGECRKVVQSCGSSMHLAQVCILEASFCYEAGNEVQAMIGIGKAVEIAMRNGYLTMFLSSGGVATRELVLKLATNRKTSLPIRDYAKTVLMLHGTESEVNAEIAMSEGDVQGYYALTEREREILHSLNAGMSRRELAESLGVSQNTVKTHLKNIYAKLGVHTRAEAYRATQAAEKR